MSKLFRYQTVIHNGNPLIPKRIANALNVSVDELTPTQRIYYKNDDFQLEYRHNFEHYRITLCFRELDSSKMISIVLKLLDAMALEPADRDILAVDDVETEQHYWVPYDGGKMSEI